MSAPIASSSTTSGNAHEVRKPYLSAATRHGANLLDRCMSFSTCTVRVRMAVPVGPRPSSSSPQPKWSTVQVLRASRRRDRPHGVAPHRARRSRPMPAGIHPRRRWSRHVSASREASSVARTRTWLPWPKVRSARERFVCSVTSWAFTTIPLMAGSSKQLVAVASRTLQSPEAVWNRNTAGGAVPSRRVAAKNLATIASRSSGWISSNMLRPSCSSGTKPRMRSAAGFA